MSHFLKNIIFAFLFFYFSNSNVLSAFSLKDVKDFCFVGPLELGASMEQVIKIVNLPVNVILSEPNRSDLGVYIYRIKGYYKNTKLSITFGSNKRVLSFYLVIPSYDKELIRNQLSNIKDSIKTFKEKSYGKDKKIKSYYFNRYNDKSKDGEKSMEIKITENNINIHCIDYFNTHKNYTESWNKAIEIEMEQRKKLYK